MASKSNQKPKHGGKRENAGRPGLDGSVRGQRRNLILDAETIDKATLIGTGNLSEGVRIAVKKYLPG